MWQPTSLRRAAGALGLAWAVLSQSAAGLGVDSTILIVGRNDGDVNKASQGLDGYGIPWEKFLVPQGGAPLPTLNSSMTQGRYGGIITIGGLSYGNNGVFASALTPQQWEQLYAYQTAFKVRMVRLEEYPGSEFGSAPVIANAGCCGSGQEQLVSLTSTAPFPAAGLKTGQGVSTKGLWHYPARVVESNTTTAFAAFAPSGAFSSESVAAVVSNFGGREQMAWFLDWAPQWSATTNFLQHTYIHWITRSLFVGKRKVHLNAQVDDVHLTTELYRPVGASFRLRPGDLDAHVAWQQRINSRLPAGSDFWLEMGHNGNGDIISAIEKPTAPNVCIPNEAVDYTSPPDTPLEFMKPPGTGVDLWPAKWIMYGWSLSCARLDDLASWFMTPANLNQFAHVSHTFSHEELNNATYHDATREIFFNQAWLKQAGIDAAQRFSPQGIIPPAITGLHNADALRAWVDNGIRYVVGDNTRPVLRNQQSMYWPLATTLQSNGFEGIVIVPRFATTIYYNCDTPDCTLQEWKDTSAGQGDFANLLDDARATNTRYLLGLQADAYMFHQANLRQMDMAPSAVGPESGRLSLAMTWVETIAQEMYRLTSWPMTSLKHDDLAKYFLDRQALDACKPLASFAYAADGRSIQSVTVTANGNACSVPVPVTIPTGAVSASAGQPRTDQVGSEPPIIWVTLSGAPVTLNLGTPVRV
ncbi:hypothetical protein CDD81_998 [Ophiocordyceps australis]|uniref:Extracellular serine-rich protein n=1 Tax=Ophiocordyceps australis TaxID=1399860 RepID=A0A2C5Y241_9HYPO|nr:hypothetical protein CDD81_998 [Ophiocordyceps australis]